MAEALINSLGRERYTAVSAGSEPAGFVHPKSLEALHRAGFVHADPRSKSWDDFLDQAFDLVITVCDNAANEPCPFLQGDFEHLHWSTPDPAQASGSDEDIDRAFDQALLSLKQRIENELL